MNQQLVIRWAAQLAFCGFAALVAAPAWSQSHILTIEEHWELHIAEPDVATSAPQTTMVMSPNGSLGGDYFLFTINHETAPDYIPGGMQVQHWIGDEIVECAHSNEYGTLATDGETVRWVQRISLDSGTLKFEIENGISDTWGQFLGDDLELSTSSSLSDLNAYKAAISLNESQVGFSENRVESLTLTKIRWLTDDGAWHEYNAPIPIDVSLDP